MDNYQAVFLGVLQGFTEFLPISSSGHLVIAQSLIPDFYQPGVLFDTVLHAGTFLAIVFYFREKLTKLDSYYIKLLLVGTIPAALVGFLFQTFFESLFGYTKLVGAALIITSVINYLTDKNKTSKKNLSISDSLFVGLFQAFAIIPGISRSGSTIYAGTKRGIDRKKAAEFSFLLSLPAVFGANILQFYTNSASIAFKHTYIIGFLAAFVSGYLAIGLVLRLLVAGKFRFFALYCLLVGVFTLLV